MRVPQRPALRYHGVMLVDPKHPFFDALWVRILCTAAPFAWSLVEISAGSYLWAAGFVGAGLYLVYALFWLRNR